MTSRVSLTFACGPYDRTLALEKGDVRAAGIDLNFITVDHPRDVFDRMAGGHEFDACEMSASEYICQYAAGERHFSAIPVFPSRAFRHSFIAVNSTRIKKPTDLNGKKIGVQLYTMTAAVWIRGLLQQDGVDLSTVTWIEGAMEKPGPHGKPSAKPLLRPVQRVPNESGKSLSKLLEDGEIDATIGADPPLCLGKVSHVQRLYPNFREAEKQYYRDTGIFPIMHLVAIKRSVCEKWPFVPTSLFNALNESKEIGLRQMKFLAALRYMLPWLPDDLDEIEDVFGGDLWPYGIDANRKTLEALVHFLHDQGMISRVIPVEELFSPVHGQNWKI
jgi:4,5-dihydroxyphthalate decarboxylase